MKKLLLSAVIVSTAVSPVTTSLTVTVLAEGVTSISGGVQELNPEEGQVWTISYPGHENDTNYYSLTQIAAWFSANSRNFSGETITLSLNADLTTNEHIVFPSSSASIAIEGNGNTIHYTGDATSVLNSGMYSAFIEMRSAVSLSNLTFELSCTEGIEEPRPLALYVTEQWDLSAVSFIGTSGNECGIFCTGPAAQEISINGCSFENLYDSFPSSLQNNTLKVTDSYFQNCTNITAKFREIAIEKSTFEGTNHVGFAYQSGDEKIFQSDKTSFVLTGNYFGSDTEVVLYAKADLSENNLKLENNVFEQGTHLGLSDRKEFTLNPVTGKWEPRWNGTITGTLDLSNNFIWDYNPAPVDQFIVPYADGQTELSKELTITNTVWYETGVENPNGNGGIVSLPNTQMNFESNDFDHITIWVDGYNNNSHQIDNVAKDTPIMVSAQSQKGYKPIFSVINTATKETISLEEIDAKIIDNRIELAKPDYAITISAQFIALPQQITITADPDTSTLNVGESTILSASVLPDEADPSITWSMDKEGIVSFNQETGEVIALSPGTVIITATSTIDPTVSTSYTIIVQEAPKPANPNRPVKPSSPSTPEPSKPVDPPVDTPILDTEETVSDFTPNSGVNAGVNGTGEGFTTPGSQTLTDSNGNNVTFTQNEDGSKAASTQNSDGEVSSAVVTIPEKAITNNQTSASLGTGKGEEQLGIVGNKVSEDTAPKITVNLPDNRETAVSLPLVDGTLTDGTVALLVEEDGSLSPIITTTTDAENNTITIPLSGSARVVIMNNALTFSDEQNTPDYALQASAYVSARGLMTGMGEAFPKPFDYNGDTTRGQFALIMYRLEGQPVVSGPYPEGVLSGIWFSNAARWAVNNGYMGQGGSRFNAEENISRDQIIAIVYRMHGSPAADLSVLDRYQDTDLIPNSEFKNAMAWGIEKGIIGQGVSELNPQEEATRAEIAAIIQRIIETLY